MNCSKIRENLSAFVDKELDASTLTAIKAHLIRCPDCRSQRDHIEEMGRDLRSIPPITAPPDFEFQIYAGIRNRTAKLQFGWKYRWRMVTVPIAAMVIGIFIGSFSLKQMFRPVMTTQSNAVTNTIGVPVLRDDFLSNPSLVSDNGDVMEYKMDRYVPRPIEPMEVNIIPEDSSSPRRPKESGTSSKMSQHRYVLEPMRVSYNETIY